MMRAPVCSRCRVPLRRDAAYPRRFHACAVCPPLYEKLYEPPVPPETPRPRIARPPRGDA